MHLARALYASLTILLVSGALASCAPAAPVRLSPASSEDDATEADEDDDDKKKSSTKGKHDEHEGHDHGDQGTSTGSGAGGAFAGAPAYKGKAPGHTANDHHDGVNTGKACLSCHDGSAAPAFAFAGSVYKGTGPAPGVEIRVVDARNRVVGLVTSDADGNFWAHDGSVGTGAMVGIRTASGVTAMHSKIANGDCNSSSCHGSSNRIKAP